MRYLLIILTLYFVPCKSQTIQSSQKLSSSSLLADFNLMKEMLMDYHPGLYRYQDSTSVNNLFKSLELELSNGDKSLKDVYLLFSKFTSSLKCGHTYCNFYNQNNTIKDSLFKRDDKVPFSFYLYDKRMFVDKNLSNNSELVEGSEVLEINKVSVTSIIDSLIQYVKGDGNNNLKRVNDLNTSGIGTFETFDIFQPLVYPPIKNQYELKFRNSINSSISTITINSISRTERFERIEKKYGKQASTYDELWTYKIIENNIGYLQIGTFVTNKLTIDWKEFINKAFEEFKNKNINNIIIDIRGNEGGDDDVNKYLAKKLAKKDIKSPSYIELLRYEKVKDIHRQYIYTWDKSFYDRTGKLKKLNNGFYTWRQERKSLNINKKTNAYSGNTYLLVDAANSSATFYLAQLLKYNEIATIIGTETGGNLKGTNGGQLFFLRLPNSKIEIDIPLIGYYPTTKQEDAGLKPDIVVKITDTDMLKNRDVVLEKTLNIIKK